MSTLLRIALIFGSVVTGVAVAIAVALMQPRDERITPRGAPLAVRVVNDVQQPDADEVRGDVADETREARPRASRPSTARRKPRAPLPPDDQDELPAPGRIIMPPPGWGYGHLPAYGPTAGAPLPQGNLQHTLTPQQLAQAQLLAMGLPVPAAPPSVPAQYVAPEPAVGQQIVPAHDQKRMQEAYDLLRQYIGNSGAAQPGAVGPLALPSGAAVPPPPAPAAGGKAAPGGTPEALPSTTVRAVPGSGPRARTQIDPDGKGKLSLRINNADLREVLDLLSEHGNLNILAGPSVQTKVSATLTGVDVESALSAILKSTGYASRRDGKFIFVGTPEEFNNIEHAMDRVATRVYRPNYITSTELQKLIQGVLTEKIGVATISTPSEAGIASDATNGGGDKYAGSDAVVVRDYEAVLAMVDQIVAEVDVRPLQVHIEAMILSVHLKDTDRYGVDFQLLRNKANINFAIGAPETNLANIKYEKGALKFGFLDGSLGAFLDALETVGDTNVIATPRLMVINKHRAEIQIGEQKGYVNTTVTETASTQSVQFLDIGALLRLRPFISSDGLIRMEVHPELSDGSVKIQNNFTLPEKEVTQVTTNIMVRDGCTVVIGGLMRENLATATSQVPVLGNLPLIGFAFRSTTETTERREVLVLITPHIVYEPGTCQEGEKAASEFHRRQAIFADKMTPFNKRSIGRRYFRLAQSAWAAGDRDTALRFAEMSVFFDPLNRAAIDLRSDIWLGRRHGEHTVPLPVTAGQLLDGPEMPEWVLDDLENAAAPTLRPMHPLDPGHPGRRVDVVRPRKLQ